MNVEHPKREVPKKPATKFELVIGLIVIAAAFALLIFGGIAAVKAIGSAMSSQKQNSPTKSIDNQSANEQKPAQQQQDQNKVLADSVTVSSSAISHNKSQNGDYYDYEFTVATEKAFDYTLTINLLRDGSKDDSKDFIFTKDKSSDYIFFSSFSYPKPLPYGWISGFDYSVTVNGKTYSYPTLPTTDKVIY